MAAPSIGTSFGISSCRWPSKEFNTSRFPALTLLLAMGSCASPPPREHYRVKHLYSTSDPQFERTMNNLLGPSLVSGNDVVTLCNGDEIFPAMLKAIRSARRSIDFETYIYWKGEIGRQFAEALAERARAHVAVHVILDW
jgi:cardiolipin synthase